MWRRSSKVYVTGTIEIENNCWKTADTIMEDCNAVIATFISGIGAGYEPIINIQPYRLKCENNIEQEWKAWIGRILGDEFDDKILECFTFLRKSDLASLENYTMQIDQTALTSMEHGLLIWFKGQAILDAHGVLSTGLLQKWL